MNNIHTSSTSAFLDALAKDKSKINEIDPTVVFRRILGVGERLDTSTILAGLQRAAMQVNKQTEFQKNIVKASFVGEVICFDVGSESNGGWCKFKVVREPLPGEVTESAVNFIVTVADKINGKRYDRLVGAIQREENPNTHAKTAVFRTISQIATVADIEKEVPPEKKEEPVVQPLFKKDELIDIRNLKAANETELSTWFMRINQKSELLNAADVTIPGAAAVLGRFKAKEDLFEADFRIDGQNIFKKLELIEEFVPVTIVLAKGSTIRIFKPEDGTDFALRVEYKSADGVGKNVIHKITGDRRFGIYTAIDDITNKDVESENCDKIFEKLKFEYDPNEVIIKKDQFVSTRIIETTSEGERVDAHLVFDDEVTLKEITSIYDPDVTNDHVGKFIATTDITIGMTKTMQINELFEKAFDKVVFCEGATVEFPDTHPDKKFKTLHAVTQSMLNSSDEFSTHFEEIIPETKENKEKTEMANEGDEIVYKKGEVFELPEHPGKKFEAKEDITVAKSRELNGDISSLVQEVTSQDGTGIADLDGGTPSGGAPAPKPVGDVPNNKLCSEEHTAQEFMEMIFGTATPNILHVMNKLKELSEKIPQTKLTGTFMTETMLVHQDYTFSIVRMKNGAFYRVFVAHTDMDRLNESTWMLTHDEKDRWFCLGNIQDRDVGQIMNRRRV